MCLLIVPVAYITFIFVGRRPKVRDQYSFFHLYIIPTPIILISIQDTKAKLQEY